MREAADSTSSPASPPSAGRGPGAPLRLLLADDQALVRGALAALLETEPDLTVVAQAASGDEVADASRPMTWTSPCWTSRCPAWTGSRPCAGSGTAAWTAPC
ncbi:hypothetical protein GY12_16720 [Micrococcus luteus]|nr:hypothetical protein GY12_16720 [Micrococcus luteus]